MMKRRSMLFVGAALMVGALLVSCGKSEKAVVKVGAVKITENDLRERLLSLPVEEQKYARTPDGRKKFIDIVARETAHVEVAKKMIDKDPKYKNLQRQFNDEIAVNLCASKIQDSINPTDDDIQKYYSANKALFESRSVYDIQLIHVSSLQIAQSALGRLQKGESFEKVAREVSLDEESASTGGNKQFESGTIAPEIEKSLESLKPGQTSGILDILSLGGRKSYCIVHFKSKKPSEKGITEARKNEIRRSLKRDGYRSRIEEEIGKIPTKYYGKK